MVSVDASAEALRFCKSGIFDYAQCAALEWPLACASLPSGAALGWCRSTPLDICCRIMTCCWHVEASAKAFCRYKSGVFTWPGVCCMRLVL